MSKYHLTNRAIEDLTDIWIYTVENWSEEQADRYYEMLLGSCAEVASKPNSGRVYGQIMNDLFGISSGRHIIFYRVITLGTVEITRILQERMDLKNKFSQ